MTYLYADLEPVKSDSLTERAYYLEDVENLLAPWRYKALQSWLIGKALILIDGREVIYEYELERFFESPAGRK